MSTTVVAPTKVSPAPVDGSAAVLSIDNVKKSFGHGWIPRRRVEVLRGASLTLQPGQLVGLVGENGSGKSTLMQIIVGLLSADSGTVRRAGLLGYCPQSSLVWDKLTVGEHFALFARAYHLNDGAALTGRDRIAEELGFTRYLGYRAEELSGGTRQKLNLALAMFHEPAILLLDEPYSGFDWETYLRFWEMAEVRRKRGMAILIVSHLLSERERLDHIYELRDGRCVES